MKVTYEEFEDNRDVLMGVNAELVIEFTEYDSVRELIEQDIVCGGSIDDVIGSIGYSQETLEDIKTEVKAMKAAGFTRVVKRAGSNQLSFRKEAD